MGEQEVRAMFYERAHSLLQHYEALLETASEAMAEQTTTTTTVTTTTPSATP